MQQSREREREPFIKMVPYDCFSASIGSREGMLKEGKPFETTLSLCGNVIARFDVVSPYTIDSITIIVNRPETSRKLYMGLLAFPSAYSSGEEPDKSGRGRLILSDLNTGFGIVTACDAGGRQVAPDGQMDHLTVLMTFPRQHFDHSTDQSNWLYRWLNNLFERWARQYEAALGMWVALDRLVTGGIEADIDRLNLTDIVDQCEAKQETRLWHNLYSALGEQRPQ